MSRTMKIRGRRKKPLVCRRRDFRHCLFWSLAMSLIVFVVYINLSFWNTRKNETNNNNNSIIPTSTPNQDDAFPTIHDTVKPLEELLSYANVTVTNNELQRLPIKWNEVVTRFGDQPKILGLETCDIYRRTVPLQQRHIAPAGAFNSGTNLLYALLERNCKINHNQYSLSKVGIDWQVNWGKHQSPRFRLENVLKEYQNNSAFLPIVMVRDPWTWFQSMCRQNYAAIWYHVPGLHCPNFIPNHVEHDWFDKSREEVAEYFNDDRHKIRNVMLKAGFTLTDHKTVPVIVRYKNEKAHHKSLAHFWNEWYQEYYDVTEFPRLMIRLEDVVFYPYETLQAVCKCAGGTLASKETFTLRGESIKDSDDYAHSKARKTDLAMAFWDHLRSNRTRGMSWDDVEYAKQVLNDSAVRQYFGYQHPPLDNNNNNNNNKDNNNGR